MAFTDEPPGLSFINNVNMAAFGPLVSQVCWLVGSLAFTAQACILLGRGDANGMTLAGLLLAAWTGKTAAGIIDSQQKRTADPRYVEVLKAKAEAEGAKVAAAAAIKDMKSEPNRPPAVTKEMRALRLSQMQQQVIPEAEAVPDHEWAAGEADKGVI